MDSLLRSAHRSSWDGAVTSDPTPGRARARSAPPRSTPAVHATPAAHRGPGRPE
ncbi:hypothetical protein FM106_24870 [Brachybacterium faecium]|nr:hypothetical protein FM106_24870 [Brachybacterium faecium]